MKAWSFKFNLVVLFYFGNFKIVLCCCYSSHLDFVQVQAGSD